MLSANFGFSAIDNKQTIFGMGDAAATDASGNAYLMASDGIYKYAPDGTQLWSTPFSNIGFVISAREQNESVAVDGAGDVYISGGYHSTATFGTGPGAITLNAIGGTDDVFLAKLDSNGNLLWAESFGGPQDDDGLGLAVDPAGNAYVSGFFDKSANFGGITLVGNNSLSTSAFVAKVSPSGSVDWAKGYSGFNLGFIGMDARGVAVDSSGNVYTTGYFTGTVNFGPTAANPLGDSLISNAFFGSEYVLKLDNNGNTIWADGSFDTDEVTGGINFTTITGKAGGTGIAVDPAGNVYTTGFVSGTANFDPLGGAAGQVETPFGNDGYVLKLDSTGRFDWVDDFQDTAAFGLGFNGVEPTGIAVDVYGNVYTTGAFEATANFNPQGVTSTSSAGGFNAYVSALDTRGQFRWLGTGTGLGDDYGYGIAVAPNHNVYVAGTFVNSFTLNPGPTPPAPLTGNGSFNSAYLWGLTQPAVTGTVWDDSADKNGIRDPGEPGVAGAVVNIYGSASGVLTTNPNALVATAITDSQGNYSFLPLNNTLKYDVQVRPPAGYRFTAENAGAAGQTQSEVDGTGLSSVIPVTTNSIEVDAGLVGVQHPFGWALGVPTVGTTAGTSIATDASGNIYVAGTFKGTQDFDPGPGTYLITSGNFGNAINDFVAKYTATGALLWVRTTSSNTDQVGIDPNAAPKLALDPITGDVDVLTLITGRTDFNPVSPGTNLVTPLLGDTSTVVLWNLDSQGNVRSARSMVGGQADAAGGLAIDSSGNIYIAGAFSNTADFDPGTGIKNLTSNGKDDIFVTKLTENGALVWAQSFGGVGNDQVNSLAVDASGNVVITGSFQGSAKFGPYTLSGGPAPATTAFVAKLLGSAPPPVPPAIGPTGGFPLWAVALPGAASSVGNGVAINQATGEIYSTGTEYASATPDTPGTAYFWKITGNGGFYQPALVLSTGDSAGRGVTVDAAGNVWATGSFSGTTNFDLYATSGTVNLTANGAHDAYLMKIGFNGFGLLQADQFGGAGEDTANAVALDSSGNVYMTGSSHGPANFDPGLATLDTFTVGSPGEQDDFVARLNVPPALPPDATPSFNLTNASVTVLENSAPYSQTGFAANIVPGAIGALPGPKGENDQSLNFAVSNTNSSLFAVQPGIDPTTGTLTFTPALDQSGMATVFVTLVDDAGARFTQLFTINVTFVNLPPSFVVNPTLPNSGDQTVTEDSGAHIVASWAANISAGPGNGDAIPSNNTLTFNFTDTNPALYAPGGFPTIDPATGNLSYTLAPDQSGSDLLTVTLSDSGGTANGGVDTSTPLTFRINALFVNDAPSFTPGAFGITTNEDAGAVSIPGWATNISPGEGANEQSQKAGLYFTLQNDHPELFSVLPAIDPATGNLTFTPMPDAASFDVIDHITVLLHDTSGTANGGVNVSAPLAQPLAITVQFVNDPPTFQINPALPNGGNQLVRFDSANQTVANFATGL
ncbi:MAG TPA: SBBP repeat-containing protein, partial [Pirellulales bacterium]|nr:SBBP repeat-containing protein [Pirellulales bacterium]